MFVQSLNVSLCWMGADSWYPTRHRGQRRFFSVICRSKERMHLGIFVIFMYWLPMSKEKNSLNSVWYARMDHPARGITAMAGRALFPTFRFFAMSTIFLKQTNKQTKERTIQEMVNWYRRVGGRWLTKVLFVWCPAAVTFVQVEFQFGFKRDKQKIAFSSCDYISLSQFLSRQNIVFI